MYGVTWQGDTAKEEVRRLLAVWVAWMDSAAGHRLGYSGDVEFKPRDDREVVNVNEAEALKVERAMQRLKIINYPAFLPVLLLNARDDSYVTAAGKCGCGLSAFKVRLDCGLGFLMAELL